MVPKNILAIAEHIASERKRSNRDDNGTSSNSAFDTTTEADVDGSQGNWTGDVRYGKNPTGKSGTHIRRQYKGTSN